ncbi:teneurin-4 isoform X9 [Rattus norvegicus]|uniref:Teneurin transmembrane protein 4 n=4 Tax=Rattus norvegicus TaxID=10116 RepID=A0ABK0LJN5_RAT|nr:teneurin-4 isoform X9 [Rattus norvegicus]XP_017444667.1 teneurin-4 isoform X9 [Rattus norvegicus]XP_017444668.1 teneurin-4 isoform X9 [Rattus norvegicus]XP_017444669.1 teneurin-4 isoform X9 [Rattus norvegicus]XP_038969083.1 teneurin-4 isoform X9 [Rattus norvegicus]XP_038969091.1 teneurin-4 isoform X9 [Rattus norvegicus]XP_038969098.1 teneurin-4 isoform X9 [Rattus norvegicus]XP_038969099.1 teneurin-4 isoform X9 [Rattus norvegicus]XP_038969101.1 teneurin-4 isoform X9 [Rattus norvegicus]|eukprot:XP_017444666.1 PREDICTED: teneurin-4 isoform X6 [Rattus norvegicus]
MEPDHSALSAARAQFVDVEEREPEAMDVKERKPYRSLTRRRDAERRYTSSSADSEEGKGPQKSYSSSETLKAYDQDARLAYGSRVKDMVPQESEEFCRTGTNFTLRELGLGEMTPPHGTLYRTDIGLPHCGYSMGASSDADLEADTVLSPEHPVRLWGRSTRSGRSSCLSSRANSNLTLTDTEHENTETGAPLHCSSASSTPIEQSPSPPPSPPANESQRRLLGNGVAQPTPDSDSEEEFVPNSFLVKSGSASLGVAANDHPSGLQNHPRLRTPPPPLPHAHTPNQHHAASINSLNRGNFTPRSNPSPAPTDHSLSGEPPAGSAQEPTHAQDNWLLNSNIPLETRNLGKQPFLGTLQDNLIEMDILSASRHDGAYSDGHFLFKPGGTSPLFCTTSPGYPLTSSTVYSPPPRPLPRSTFSRPAFNLKKPSKYCNWKCAALSAILISATLVILLAYFVAMHLFGLNWHLQPMEGQMYEITEDTASSWPVPTDVSLYPSGGTGLETPDRKGKGAAEGKPSSLFPEDSFIDSGEIDVGRRASQKIPPGTFWRSQVFIDHPVHLKFNVSLGKAALVGIYGRKGLPPSHTQFDFVELLDGRRLLTQEARSLEGPQRQSRGTVPPSSHETGFIQYLDSGIWHLAFYNDGKESEVVSFLTTTIESVENCPSNCYGNGDCISGTCHCFLGFLGPDCGRASCPVLCSGNGQYMKGRCLCHSGWKGAECDVPTNQCIDVACSSHGTCIMGTCICNPGYKGESCEEVDCMDPTCSSRGVCVRGECHCSVGWGGTNCETPRATCLDQCSGHGTFLPDTGLCNCDPSWTGHDCSIEICAADCGGHGVCVGGTCRCEDGWMGAACDQRACHPRCAEHGTCRDGKCECSPGWNGEHCTIAHYLDRVVKEGCPGLCNGNGRCTLDLNGWHCVCQLGWRGAGCDTSMETACGDSKDNDGDGLVDCMDPDCCLQPLCHVNPLCLGSPDPLDIIQETQAPVSQQNLHSFYDRIKFLVGRDSTHVIPGENPFDGGHACVIRGQVMTSDGTPLVGVNISFINNPLFGYTISRQDGSFDLVTNGGISIILRFERAPFITQEHTLWLPWDRFFVMETIIMRHEENEIPSCDLSNFARPNPVVSPSPLTSFASSCAEKGPIVPEIQALQEEIIIAGCKMRLSYLSSRTPGYKSVLRISLTHPTIPFNLMKVHLMVAVEGRLFRKWFAAAPDLSYYFIWDKTDVYNQKVFGLSEAFVSVGYEYESCPDLILWEKRTAVLQGYEIDASKLGGWSLDKHHALNIQSGILHKGNGENQFVSQQPPVIGSIMGNGRRRSISCPSCNGLADGNKLLAPVALTCGSDGSLYVGDFNYIRRIFPSGNVTNILEMRNKDFRHSHSPAHKYYLATDPMSGAVFLSDTNSRRVFKIKSTTVVKDLVKNSEVVAGTGDQCLPFDDTRCGDGGKATEATLTNPRGITVDKFGLIYFVDGTMIRRVDQNGIISTLLGSNDLTSARPLSCDSVMDISQVRLEWPTDLAINPMDNSLYVLDNNVVLQISENHQVRIVAGRPMHCQVPGIDHFLLSKVAIHATLESATALAVSHNGVLYIAETDEKKINRIRQVTTSGEISLVAGAPSGCDCKNDANCDCFSGDDGYAKDAKLNTPSSLAVCADGELYVADLGNIRIRFIRKNKPVLNTQNMYELSSPIDQELYLFDTSGKHLYTQSLPTGDYLYNFTYTGDGDITHITDNNGNMVNVRRDSTGMPLWLVVPDGQVYWVTMGTNSALRSVTTQGHELAMMTYHGNSGLLATKSNENGWTTFYEYDSFGRLTNVTFPTGQVSSFRSDTDSSVHVQVETSSKDDVTITTNLSASGAFYTLLQDQVRNSYYIGADGSLRLLLANGMEVALQSEPHLLAGTVNPTVGKRNVTLPIDNGLNLVEWRQRKEQARGQVTVFGRRLRVHNRNLLSLDFDRVTRTEKIYDDHRKFTLRILYDQAGRPSLWSPSSRLNGVNVTYSPGGHIAGIQRGIMSERMEYDQAGRITSRIFADGKMWSYTYLEKSMVLHLHSQRQYIFEFDKNDRLSSVTMPNVARQTLETIRSVGYYRNIYQPPEGNASVIQDFTEDGHLLHTFYLGTGRRVIYKYGKLSKLAETLYDTTKVSFTYDESAGMLKTVNLQNEGFTCTIRYRQIGPLIDRQIFRFTEEGMVNARFDYNYDNSFRVTSMQAVINETPLPIDLYRYDDVSGKTEQFGKFGVIYYDINQIITTAVMTHTKHFDAYGRMKEVQYEIFRSLMYWMTVQYDNMGRVVKKELKVGPYANTTRYSYEYDADGQLQTVSINDKPLWRYSYDLNGNLHLLSPGNSARLTPLRYDLRDRITRLGDVQYKMDEDGFLRQRGGDVFEYNSAGLLIKAYNRASGWSVRYRYDGLGRRVSSKSSHSHHLQFFYADLTNPTKVTHLYNHSSSEITSLYYDLQGHLFAMELSSGDEFYIACDNIGTPLAVFSGTGLMIKQILYTAYGEIYMDTNPNFQIIIGYHGGLYDPLTKLVHMGRRDYDVLAGRWTSPDHELWKRLSSSSIVPFHLYMFKNNNPISNSQDIKCFMTDVNSWLLTFGFQLHNVIPGYPKPDTDAMEPSYELVSTQMKTQEWDNSKSILGVQCEVQKQLKAFVTLERFDQLFGSTITSCQQAPETKKFASSGSIFGKGVKFALKDGRVTTDIISVANEDGRRIAAILNNAHYLENLHFTIDGVDTHYFVKPGPSEGDLAILGLSGGRRTLENGVNVTVSQINTMLGGRTRRYTDIQLQYRALCLNTRYGTTVDEEKVRVLELARQRAVRQAWAREQQRLREGEEGLRAWTDGEKQQVLNTGRVQGYDGFFVTSVEQYPELSDSANNIHFMRQSEMGRR